MQRSTIPGQAFWALVLLMLGGVSMGKDSVLSLGADHFRDTASVTDLPQDATATISTENGYSEKRGPMRTVWDDEFFTATIDKKTGQKTFQVVVWMIYDGAERNYQQVSFDTPQGPRTLTATQLSSKREFCSVGECTHTERLAFPVEEGMLRQMAGQSGPALWSFKLAGKTGPAYSGSLSYAEAAGLLARVDSYHSALPVIAATAARAALKANLGIEGLPVSGSAQLPNRAGILVTSVASGSVGEHAGLIVGDILSSLDGHPLKSLADLQKAVAACAPNSSAAIKLFRGLEDTKLDAHF